MTDFLVATSSVHVTAAAADYLTERANPGEDGVVVAVREPAAPARDAGDAVNVARSRLATLVPTTDIRDGDPETELLAAIEEHDPDEVLIGANRGVEGSEGVGSTARALLSQVDRPVVVVPLPDR